MLQKSIQKQNFLSSQIIQLKYLFNINNFEVNNSGNQYILKTSTCHGHWPGSESSPPTTRFTRAEDLPQDTANWTKIKKIKAQHLQCPHRKPLSHTSQLFHLFIMNILLPPLFLNFLAFFFSFSKDLPMNNINLPSFIHLEFYTQCLK